MPRTLITFVVIVIAFSAAVNADSWLPPSPQIVASQHGRHGFKLTPNYPKQSAATGELFTIDEAGNEHVYWKAGLVNNPHQVFVSQYNQQVITIDTYASLGWAHAIVVYDNEGQVIGDYKLEDLLSDQEIREHVQRSSNSRWWAEGASFKFRGAKQFIITTHWGKEITIDLQTGRLV